MSSYRPGDVLLVDYPFTTLDDSKRRPALVLLDASTDDILLARITSSATRDRFDVEITDWESAGLLAPSVVRLGKLLTIADSIVLRRFGSLSTRDHDQVGFRLRTMFDIDWAPPPSTQNH